MVAFQDFFELNDCWKTIYSEFVCLMKSPLESPLSFSSELSLSL